jgi:hypothetical protein
MRCLLLLPLLTCCAFVTAQYPIHWQLHEAATYQVHFTTAVKTDFAVLGNNARDTGLAGSVEGSLRFVYAGSKDSTGIFFCSFTQVDRIHLPLPEADQLQVKEDLLKGFYCFQRQNGVIDSIYFPYPFSDAAEHITVQLLEYYQYYLPALPMAVWQKQVQVTDGWVVANWRTDSAVLPQQAIRLTGLTPVYDNRPGSVLTRSNQYDVDVSYRLGDHGKWQRITGSVKRQGKMNHKTITTLTNTFSFVLRSVNNFTAYLPPLNPGYVRTLYYPEKWLAKARENDFRKSKGITIAGILEQLRENEWRKDENRQDKLAGDIRVCFLAGKDSLNLLRDAFMQADVNGFTFKTIRTALVTSATPYAQEVMAGYIIAQKSNWNALKKIIPSCGVVANPTYPLQQMLEVIAFDKQAADNNRAAAQLALGNIAGTVRKTAIARADSIAVRLAALLANQGDDLLYLSALGNCGTSSSLRFIIPYLSDTNMAIKGMAFYALRFIEEPAVDSIFVRALQQEQDADLLINIFNALYFRSSQQGMIEALEHIIQQHAPDKVRLSALQVLFEYSYREPVLLTVIGRIANGNASAATRDAANEFLRKIQ